MKLQSILPDRISALPEPIIHDILSLLPTKSVKMATCLSKTWYDFCSSFPYLDFYDYLFDRNYDIVTYTPKRTVYYYDYNDDEIDIEEDKEEEEYEDRDLNLKAAREKYVNYVSQTLRRFHERNPRTQIKRIRVPITIINSRFASILDGWIQLALEHGVEEFDLEIRGTCYELPKAVFKSSSIRVLKLEGCSLSEPFEHTDVSSSATTTTLQELDLKRVHMDEVALRSIIMYCPLIEELCIEDPICITNFRFSHLHRLKNLVIKLTRAVQTKVENIEVDAPTLQTLKVQNSTGRLYYPTKIEILECPILSELYLDYFAVDNFQFEEILSRLPLLRSLSLAHLHLLSKLTISKDSLNELVVSYCDDLKELEIDAPNLRLFLFEGNLVHLISPMHTVMGKPVVSLVYQGWESFDRFAVKCRNFISQLKHITYLDLCLEECEMIMDEDMDERVVQPVESVPYIEELQINMYKSGDYYEIFDGLLSNCHPHILTLISQHSDYCDDDFFQFIRYLMVNCNRARPSFHEKTWRCCLEDIIFVVEGAIHRMSVIRNVSPSFLERSRISDFKFVFKW